MSMNTQAAKRQKTGEALDSSEWKAFIPSEFASLCKNPIRKIVDNIKKPENAAKPLIPLSLGDPTVFGNLKCPDVLTEAIVRNVRAGKNNGYCHSAGLEAAREAVATYVSTPKSPLTKEDVIIASGCSGALDIAISGLLNAGDNILLPQPGFPLYEVICDVYKIECKFYRLIPEKNWEVDLEHLKSLVDGNTKCILVNNPSNPCGSVYSKTHLKSILQTAEDSKLAIIADEIYGDMVFEGQVFYPMASLTSTVPVVAVGGLAKQFLVPGWRVGWVTVHDRNALLTHVREGYYKLSQLILGANALVQSVLPDVLSPVPGSEEEQSLKTFKNEYFAEMRRNATFTMERLQNIPGLKIVVPQGAMYVMVKVDTEVMKGIQDDFDFTQKLLNEESVFVLPGQCFGMANYFRVVFCAPKEKLGQAYDRIEAFCRRYSQSS